MRAGLYATFPPGITYSDLSNTPSCSVPSIVSVPWAAILKALLNHDLPFGVEPTASLSAKNRHMKKTCPPKADLAAWQLQLFRLHFSRGLYSEMKCV